MGTADRNLNLRRYNKPSDNKIKKVLTITTWNLILSYVLSGNKNVTRRGLTNIQKFMDICDPETYMGEPEKVKRVELIKKGLEARLQLNLNNPDIILEHIKGLFGDDIELTNNDISDAEIRWFDNYISSILQYSTVYNYAEELMRLCTKIKSDTVDKDLVRDFEETISNVNRDLKKLEPTRAGSNVFSLNPGVFEDKIIESYNLLSSDANKIKTNMVGLNSLLKGGFEKSRVYILFGATGGGKSLTLMNLAYQLKKANKGYECSDPTKRPCIIYMTMENSIEESLNRLFKISNDTTDMKQYDVDDVISGFRRNGLDYTEDGDEVNLIIEYVPESINTTTDYVRTMIENYEEEGYEVICVIQDHIKKLKSNDRRHSDNLRIELGEIVNQLKVIAIEKKIPIISNSHFNREADRKLEEAMSANKYDRVKLITRDNIGESYLMLDNTDVGIAVAMDYDVEGNKYIGIKILKSRDGIGLTSNTIFQPFSADNNIIDGCSSSIKFVEDVGLSLPMYKTTLNPNGNSKGPNIDTGRDNIRVSPYLTNNTEINNIFEYEG